MCQIFNCKLIFWPKFSKYQLRHKYYWLPIFWPKFFWLPIFAAKFYWLPNFRLKASSKIFYWPFQGGTFLWIFYVFVLSCVCYVFVRVCLYVLCGHLLGKGWPLGSRLWCLLWVCLFPIGILGQVWYLIVSIPDLCTLTYFKFYRLPIQELPHWDSLIQVKWYTGWNIFLRVSCVRNMKCHVIGGMRVK